MISVKVKYLIDGQNEKNSTGLGMCGIGENIEIEKISIFSRSDFKNRYFWQEKIDCEKIEYHSLI